VRSKRIQEVVNVKNGSSVKGSTQRCIGLYDALFTSAAASTRVSPSLRDVVR
jgi:hypothetical protein